MIILPFAATIVKSAPVRSAARSVAMLGLVACSGSTEPRPSPTLAVSAASGAIAIPQGLATSIELTVARGGGFSGSVTMTVDGLPAGVTATFAPASLPGTMTTAMLQLSVGSEVPTRDDPVLLTVRARGAGVEDATATIALTIPSGPAFELRSVDQELLFGPGEGRATIATVTRQAGFTGSVTLAATAGHAGLRVALEPSVLPEGVTSARLSVDAESGVPPGVYEVQVTATAPARTPRVAAVQVTIAAGTRIVMPFCGRTTPVWVASQSGTDNWRRIAPGAGSFTFYVDQRGGLATLHVDADSIHHRLTFATAAEFLVMAEAAALACDPLPARVSISGTVAGYVAGVHWANLHFGAFSGTTVSGTPVPHPFENAMERGGITDVVATRFSGDGGVYGFDRAIVRHGVTLSAGATLAELDLAGPDAVLPETGTLAVDGSAPSDRVTSVIALRSARRTHAFLSSVDGPARQSYVALPAVALAPGDVHMAWTGAEDRAGQHARLDVQHFTTAADRTQELGPAMSSVEASVTTTADRAFPRIITAVQQEYDGYALAYFHQPAPLQRTMQVIATAGYRDGSAQWDLQIPDFHALGGNNHHFVAGTPIEWRVQVLDSSYRLFMPQAPFDGLRYRTAARYSGERTGGRFIHTHPPLMYYSSVLELDLRDAGVRQ